MQPRGGPGPGILRRPIPGALRAPALTGAPKAKRRTGPSGPVRTAPGRSEPRRRGAGAAQAARGAAPCARVRADQRAPASPPAGSPARIPPRPTHPGALGGFSPGKAEAPEARGLCRPCARRSCLPPPGACTRGASPPGAKAAPPRASPAHSPQGPKLTSRKRPCPQLSRAAAHPGRRRSPAATRRTGPVARLPAAPVRRRPASVRRLRQGRHPRGSGPAVSAAGGHPAGPHLETPAAATIRAARPRPARAPALSRGQSCAGRGLVRPNLTEPRRLQRRHSRRASAARTRQGDPSRAAPRRPAPPDMCRRRICVAKGRLRRRPPVAPWPPAGPRGAAAVHVGQPPGEPGGSGTGRPTAGHGPS